MSSQKHREGDPSPGDENRRDPILDELRQKIYRQLLDELGPLLSDRHLSDDDVRQRVRDQLHSALAKKKAPLSATDKTQLMREVTDDILGYGPIDHLLKDDAITEVMVNGPNRVYVERRGRLEPVPASFMDEAHLRRIIDRMVSQAGRAIDEVTPMVDARLPNGFRVNAIIAPLAIGGPFLTIRKFSSDPATVDDLLASGSLNETAARFLEACVAGRLNIIVSGRARTGRTTTLNVLSSFIPDSERIITVEDAKELQLHQDHVLSLETRPPNAKGKGEITLGRLLRNALRMRPDRVIVGEVRGGEVLDMLGAMNTGHTAWLTTVHSNSPRDTLARIETMALMAGLELPVRAIREQMTSGLQVIVHQARLSDGSCRVTHITEVEEMRGEVIALQDIFLFDHGMGIDDQDQSKGYLKATGIRPTFADKLAQAGIELSSDLFGTEDFFRPVVLR